MLALFLTALVIAPIAALAQDPRPDDRQGAPDAAGPASPDRGPPAHSGPPVDKAKGPPGIEGPAGKDHGPPAHAGRPEDKMKDPPGIEGRPKKDFGPPQQPGPRGQEPPARKKPETKS